LGAVAKGKVATKGRYCGSYFGEGAEEELGRRGRRSSKLKRKDYTEVTENAEVAEKREKAERVQRTNEARCKTVPHFARSVRTDGF
jgi:hypothetical protein